MNGPNRSRSNETWLRVIVGVSLAIALIVIVYLLNLVWVWFQNLDKILIAALPATLGGLALTAAAFVGGTVSDLRSQLDTILDEAQTERDKALREADKEGKIREFEAAQQWIDEQSEPPDRDTIRDLDAITITQIKTWLQSVAKVRRKEAEVAERVLPQKKLIWSFRMFALCLIETLTLDLWVNSEQFFGEQIRRAAADPDVQLKLDPTSTGILASLDVVLGSGLLVAGVYFLWAGARRLV